MNVKKLPKKTPKQKLPTIQSDEIPITFEDFDQFELKSFAESLKNHLIAETPHTEGSLAVSINQLGSQATEIYVIRLRNLFSSA